MRNYDANGRRKVDDRRHDNERKALAFNMQPLGGCNGYRSQLAAHSLGFKETPKIQKDLRQYAWNQFDVDSQVVDKKELRYFLPVCVLIYLSIVKWSHLDCESKFKLTVKIYFFSIWNINLQKEHLISLDLLVTIRFIIWFLGVFLRLVQINEFLVT